MTPIELRNELLANKVIKSLPTSAAKEIIVYFCIYYATKTPHNGSGGAPWGHRPKGSEQSLQDRRLLL